MDIAVANRLKRKLPRFCLASKLPFLETTWAGGVIRGRMIVAYVAMEE